MAEVIPAEAVEAALAANREYKSQRSMDNAEKQMRAVLEAAAPHMLSGDRAEVWAEGHEAGFWNGRMSSGDTSNMALIGKEHADATNPYRKVTR